MEATAWAANARCASYLIHINNQSSSAELASASSIYVVWNSCMNSLESNSILSTVQALVWHGWEPQAELSTQWAVTFGHLFHYCWLLNLFLFFFWLRRGKVRFHCYLTPFCLQRRLRSHEAAGMSRSALNVAGTIVLWECTLAAEIFLFIFRLSMFFCFSSLNEESGCHSKSMEEIDSL